MNLLPGLCLALPRFVGLGLCRLLRRLLLGRVGLSTGVVRVPAIGADPLLLEVGFHPAVNPFGTARELQPPHVDGFDILLFFGKVQRLLPLDVSLFGHFDTEEPLGDEHASLLGRQCIPLFGPLLLVDFTVLLLVAFAVKATVVEFDVALRGINLNVGIALVSRACRIAFEQNFAARKKISLEILRKLPSPMHLIRIRPVRIDCLFSDFKKLGCSPRQTLLFEEMPLQEDL